MIGVPDGRSIGGSVGVGWAVTGGMIVGTGVPDGMNVRAGSIRISVPMRGVPCGINVGVNNNVG